MFRSIYPTIKELLASFSPEKRGSFKEVVLAEHPRKGEYVFGFVTSEILVELPEGKRQMVTVFIPTNNLYLGDVIVVPREEALATGLSVEEGIRIILSAGTAAPPGSPGSAAEPPPAHARASARPRRPSGKSFPKKKWSAPSMMAVRAPGSRSANGARRGKGQYCRACRRREQRDAPPGRAKAQSSMPSGGATRQSGSGRARWPGATAPRPRRRRSTRRPRGRPAGTAPPSAASAARTSSSLPAPPVMGALGGADPAEVEPEGGTPALRHLGRPDHHGVVHVPAVERMGMAHDEPGGGRWGTGEAGLELRATGHLDFDGALHSFSDLGSRGIGNIRGRGPSRREGILHAMLSLAASGIAPASRPSRPGGSPGARRARVARHVSGCAVLPGPVEQHAMRVPVRGSGRPPRARTGRGSGRVSSADRAEPPRPLREPWWLPFWKPVWGHPRMALATGLAGDVAVRSLLAGR